jgi:hypothetical protein
VDERTDRRIQVFYVGKCPMFGPASRVWLLKVIVVLVFCLGLVMSLRLWIGPRSYPLAPVFDFLPPAAQAVDDVLFAGLFALAAAMLVSSRPQKFIAGFLAIIAIFCLLDQTRWQPWVFLYGFLRWRCFPGTAGTRPAAIAPSTSPA